MAQGKKKKKVTSNPSRGFATTSVPSKPKIEDDVVGVISETAGSTLTTEVSASKVEDPYEPSKRATQSTTAQGPTEEISDMSPEQLEEYLQNAEIQTLLDKHGSWCKAEANRQFTRLKNQHRQLRIQAERLSTSYWLTDKLIQHIFGLLTIAEKAPVAISKQSEIQSSLNDRPKLLLNLWILYLVLELLHLPKRLEGIEYIVELSTSKKILKVHDYVWGLQECLEWYGRNVDASDLPDYDSGMIGSHQQQKLDSGGIISNAERPDSDMRDSPEHNEAASDGDPSYSTDTSDSTIDDNEPTMLEQKYIRLKTSQFIKERPKERPEQGRKLKKTKRMERIQHKLDLIERDILFDKPAAEQAWQPILNRLRAEKAEASKDLSQKRFQNSSDIYRLDGLPKDDPDSVSSTDEKKSLDINVPDEFEGGSLFGDMFISETVEGGPISEGHSQSETVRQLNFGNWSGMSPRDLLEEISQNHDEKRQIRLQILNKTSASVRHQVELSWSTETMPDNTALASMPVEVDVDIKPLRWKLQMRGVAASDVKQSEAYCCMLSLFLLYCINSKEQKQDNRLATVWKNLMKELVDTRKELIDAEDKSTLKILREVIQKASKDHEQSRAIAHPAASSQTETTTTAKHRTARQHPLNFSSERALKEWNIRTSRPAFQQMFQFRQQLPINDYKNEILSTIHKNSVSIICAETGAGKSTGIPVLILEQNLSEGRDVRILVTQPRRISAITLARRVSQEVGEDKNDIGTARSLIGYAIRLESKTSSTTRITYATTGVLLRMIEDSADLEDLDYIVLDEVHERTMDLDLLFIALRQIQHQMQRKLKLILMSATVDARKFSNYFGDAPILNLPGRTYPVEIGFLEDAVEVTNDIKNIGDSATKRIAENHASDEEDEGHVSSNASSSLTNYSLKTRSVLAEMDEYRVDFGLVAKLATAIATKECYAKYSAAILIFMPGIGEIRRMHNTLLSSEVFDHGWVFHLLHSSFSTEELEKAFATPPIGYRKIVIATNIAETGITIPDITAVIDTCKEKIMRYNERRQLSKLTEGFISRSSARQRRGRAARVQDGICFHLVTRLRYDNLMLEQQVPELLRLSLQGAILRIKMWNMGSVEETLSAAIDPPSGKAVTRAIEKLKEAGALNQIEILTPLGQKIARIPLELNLAKLALLGTFFKCLDPILAIVSILTSKSPFISLPTGGPQTTSKVLFNRADSDLISSLNAYQGWKKAKMAGSAHDFCRKNRLMDQNFLQVEDQKIQLLTYLVDASLIVLTPDEKSILNKARSPAANALISIICQKDTVPMGSMTRCFRQLSR